MKNFDNRWRSWPSKQKMTKTISDLSNSADIRVALTLEKHRHFAKITENKKDFTIHSDDKTDDLYTGMDKSLKK